MIAGRGFELAAVVAVGAAFVGLVVGVQQTSRGSRHASTAVAPSAGVVGARTYRDMQTEPAGANASKALGWWAALAQQRPTTLTPPAVTYDPARAAASRRQRRAFDGAPPTIPHQIDQLAVPACLTCHGDGLMIAAMQAPPMSHPAYASCVQCHVVDVGPVPGSAPPVLDNRFEPVTAGLLGTRAWAGAPPTIPHRTFMRERCEACHGTFGEAGVQSSHPWRASCMQCHVSDANADQRALGQAP